MGGGRSAQCWPLVGACLIGLAWGFPALAAPQSHAFRIQAEDLAQALRIFGDITNHQIVFDGDLIKGRKNRAVAGTMPDDRALTLLLGGSGLSFQKTDQDVYLVTAAPSPAHATDRAQPPRTETAPVAKPEADKDVSVVITGIRTGLRSSMNLKRRALRLDDAITAEDIGKFPDKNIGDALQRVTGVQINRIDGEGATVSIRGADPSLVRTEVDGLTALPVFRFATSRAVDFRNFPVEFIDRLEVVKSVTPDMTEGGLGGTIRVVMRKPFDSKKPFFAVTAQSAYSSEFQTYDPKFSLIGSRLFLNDTLGVLFSASYEDRHLGHDATLTTGWVRKVDLNGDGIMDWTPDIPRPDMDRRETIRTAASTVVQWRPADNFELTYEGNLAFGNEHDDLQLLQLTASAGAVDAAKTTLGATPDGSGAYTVNHIELVSDAAHQMGLSYRNVLGKIQYTQWDSTLTFKWKPTDRLTLDGHYGTSGSYFDMFERDAIATITALPRAVVDYNNSAKAPNITLYDASGRMIDPTSGQGVDTLMALYQNIPTKAVEADVRFNAEYRLNSSVLQAIKAGVERHNTEFGSDAWKRQATLTSNPVYTASGQTLVYHTSQPAIEDLVNRYAGVNKLVFGHDGDIGYADGIRSWNELYYPVYNAIQQASGDSLDITAANPNPNTGNSFRTWPSAFHVRERTLAFYAQAAFEVPVFGDTLSGVFGDRVITTHTAANGYVQTRAPDGSLSFPLVTKLSQYTNDLPSLNLKMELVPDALIGRFSVGKVMARPTPSELSFGQTLDVVGLTGSQGNPNLKPFQATDMDLALESYFSKDAYLSVTLFEKDISRFIVNTTIPYTDVDGTTYSITMPVNGTDRVKIRGLEIGGQVALTWLPAPFDGLGLLGNATLQRDRGFRGVNLIDGTILPFPGLSRTSYNAGVYYENARFSARLSYNWRSRWLVNASGRGGLPEFNEAYGALDASVNYALAPHFTAFVDGTNLTKSQYIQENDPQRLISNEIDGLRVFFGVRYRQ